MKHKKQAFTLVELIVVITILTILWTIAFLSLQWYSKDSRNSVRFNDLKLIESSLELYSQKTWFYPESTLPVEITFSNAEAWKQGTFWDDTFNSVWKLDHLPVDPLTGTEYTYSLLNTKVEYEVAAALEWVVANNDINLINKTYAWNLEWTSLVLWTYNWNMLKVSTWWLDYVLAVPTIISWDITLLSVDEITFYKKLAYNGSRVLAWNYVNTEFDMSKEFDYWFDSATWWLIIFTWSINDLKTDGNKRIQLLDNLQKAYSWTAIETNTDFTQLINESIDTSSPTTSTKTLAKTIIENSLFIEVKNINTPVSIFKTILDWGVILWEVFYWTIDWTYTWLTCNDDIMISNWITWSWITISACNVGASVVWTWITSYGWLYQWWNNYDFRDSQFSNWWVYTWLTSTTLLDSSSYWPLNYFNSSTFIINWWWTNDWSNPRNNNLWWDTTNTDVARKWPCENWYHIPSRDEWVLLHSIWLWWANWNQMRDVLKIPNAWGRNNNAATFLDWWADGSYWTSSPNITTFNEDKAHFIWFNAGWISPGDSYFRAYAFSIRCFKNN